MVAIDEESMPSSGTYHRPTQPLVNNLYQGMTLDAVAGLCYERNRDYSPSLGRWMEQDPAQYINGANTYQFVDSSPVGMVDAWGEYWALHFTTGWANNQEAFDYKKVSGWETTAWGPASEAIQVLTKLAVTLAGTYGLPNIQPYKAFASFTAGQLVNVDVQVNVRRSASGGDFWGV